MKETRGNKRVTSGLYRFHQTAGVCGGRTCGSLKRRLCPPRVDARLGSSAVSSAEASALQFAQWDANWSFKSLLFHTTSTSSVSFALFKTLVCFFRPAQLSCVRMRARAFTRTVRIDMSLWALTSLLRLGYWIAYAVQTNPNLSMKINVSNNLDVKNKHLVHDSLLYLLL